MSESDSLDIKIIQYIYFLLQRECSKKPYVMSGLFCGVNHTEGYHIFAYSEGVTKRGRSTSACAKMGNATVPHERQGS